MTMEGNMNGAARDPFVRRDSDIRQLMTALRELQEMLSAAQMIWGTGRCMIDKKAFADHVDLIARLLPESVKQASDIVRNAESIRESAKREATEQTARARDEAQKTVDAAAKDAERVRSEGQKAAEEAARANASALNTANTLKAEAEKDAAAIRQKAQNAANELYGQAQREANNLIARAQQEAQMMRADAENAAREAVANENVYRMATMKANELREETEKSMVVMRQKYMSELYQMMGEMDQYLCKLVSSVREERQNLINMH